MVRNNDNPPVEPPPPPTKEQPTVREGSYEADARLTDAGVEVLDKPQAIRGDIIPEKKG